MSQKLKLWAGPLLMTFLLAYPAYAVGTKLSQITSGGSTNPATDVYVGVRNGDTDVLLTPFAGSQSPWTQDIDSAGYVINDNAGTPLTSIDPSNRELFDTDGLTAVAGWGLGNGGVGFNYINQGVNAATPVINVGNTQLVGGGGTDTFVDWSGTQNSAAALSFDSSYNAYFRASIYDQSVDLSIDPNNRLLYTYGGSQVAIDYSDTINNSAYLSFAGGVAHFQNPTYGDSFYATDLNTGFVIVNDLNNGSNGFDASAVTNSAAKGIIIGSNFYVTGAGEITGIGSGITSIPDTSINITTSTPTTLTSGFVTNNGSTISDLAYGASGTDPIGNVFSQGLVTTVGTGNGFNYSGVISATLGGNITIVNGLVTAFTAAN